MNRSQRVVDITPEQGLFDLGLRELFEARRLIWSFMQRGLLLRYRQTALGIAWVVLQPLLASGVLALVFGTFAGLSSTSHPYLLTVYAGMLPWTLFSQSIQRGGAILVTDRSLVTKTWLPRMVLPLSSVFAVLVDVLVALACFFPIAFFFYSITPTLQALVLPVLFVPLLALCIGTTLICAGLNVYYRDVQQTLPFLLQVVFFASPIAYASERITGAFAPWLRANPLVGHIEAFRWALLGRGEFPMSSWLTACAASCVVLALGVFGFRRIERSLADVI